MFAVVTPEKIQFPQEWWCGYPAVGMVIVAL